MNGRLEHSSVLTPEQALALAEPLLAPLGDRWRHTLAVAARCVELSCTVAARDHELLVSAAWLHDLGYAEALLDTGLHALDGARYLSQLGNAPRLCALVAHHSGARFEASERGLEAELAEYELEESAVMDALVAADLTTGPRGERLSYGERIGEILARYDPETAVHRAVVRSQGVMSAHVQRAHRRLALLGRSALDQPT